MTRERQKQYEILYAESLAKDRGYAWKVEVPPNEDDWPDLLIKTSNDIFGREVRNIYVDDHRKGSFERKDESFRQKLLNELSGKYYAKKNVPIQLSIRGPFDKDSVDKILDYLLSTEFQEGRIIKHNIIIKANKTRLFDEKMPSSFVNYNRWVYMNDNIGWVERITDEVVENIAKEKSFNINKYKKNIKNISLLIVSNRRNNSGKIHLEKSRNINTYGFKKVYFYMYPLEVIVYEND